MELLREAEEIDYYQALCKRSALNWQARNTCWYVPWHDQIDAQIIEQEYGLLKKGVRVVMMNPTADGGMPHTRPLKDDDDLICLPAHSRANKARLEDVLQHELVHIDQRKNPEKWMSKLLEDGWEPMTSSEVPAHLQERCRLNPDTLQLRFPAWKGRYIPLPLFERADKPNLRDVQVRWYDIPNSVALTSPPTSFTQKYGDHSSSSLEHPFELWAYNRW
jgi:hypothetical protein